MFKPFAFAALTILAAAPAQAQDSAQRLVTRSLGAAGGAANWNALPGLHESGSMGEAKVQRWVDTIRYGLRIETRTSDGKLFIQGYNGAGEWRLLTDGKSTGSDAPADVAEIRSDAYFAAYGYFFPSRFERRMTLIGVRRSYGKTYDVVRIQPAGGEPREVWFDRRTGLPGLLIDETGPRQGRTDLTDWQKSGRVLLPRKMATTGGGRTQTETFTLEAVDFDPADRARFSLPRVEAPPLIAAPAP